jgi:carboxypeptidase Q
MRIPLLLVPAILSSAFAQAADFSPAVQATARQLMQAALQGNNAYAIVESLTTEVGPRLAGTAAEARAREWAVARLKAIGFSNVRIEPFEVPVWLRGIGTAEVLSPYPQPLVIAALGGSPGTGPGGVSGEVVAFASLAELQAVPAGSLQGKIVFIDEVMTRTQDGSGYGVAVAKRLGAGFAAARAGAGAALIRSVGTGHDRFPHTGLMQAADETSAAAVPAAALAAPDADQLRRMLDRGQPVTLNLVLTPQRLPPATSGNVIAEIPGSQAPGEIVLAGAHLDSWDLGTGAVDDGAGVGIVVGAAQLLLEQLPRKPRRTVRVVLFGAEEVGYVGAQAYASDHAQELPRHIIAAESDFGTGDIWRLDTAVAPDKVAAATAIGELLRPLGIGPGSNSARGGSDLGYISKAGVPVADLKQNGWDYFDLHHTANDTLDKVAPDALNQNVAAYAAFIYLVADSEVSFR